MIAANSWLPALLQLLVLLPSSWSCYFAVKNQMKYPFSKTAGLCAVVLVPYCLACAWLCGASGLSVNGILLPSLAVFFFLYCRTIQADRARCLAVYIGVCAVQTFPAQLAHAFDAALYPASSAADLSFEAALFQLGLSCLIVLIAARPACRLFSQAVDRLNFPKIWYSTVAISAVFLLLNLLAVPQSYSVLQADRLLYLFPILECSALVLLTAIYVLFYRGAMVILEHAELKERSQLLELQSRQYHALQRYMNQTARLRHDFRHSVRLLSALVEKGDMDSIRTHLAEYDTALAANPPANYCANPALNALFGYYHEMAVSAGVEMDWHMDLPQSLAAAELDLAALFGNLMENAIDGCLTAPAGKRYFCLTAEMHHQKQLYIVSTNSFDGQVKKDGDDYISTKHSGKGTGLASIATVAEKYGGSMNAGHSGKEFFVDVVLEIGTF